jgi:hypothetical protein
MNRYSYIGGQAYAGYDFQNSLGIRFGTDIDYVEIEGRNPRDFAIATAFVAVFLEAVCGF